MLEWPAVGGGEGGRGVGDGGDGGKGREMGKSATTWRTTTDTIYTTAAI